MSVASTKIEKVVRVLFGISGTLHSNKSEYDKLVSSNIDRWTTYTERVTTWGDGHKTYDKFNIKQHFRTTSVHQYRDYKVLYLDQEFLDTYECDHCGRQYQRTRINPIEKERQETGIHLNTEVHEK